MHNLSRGYLMELFNEYAPKYLTDRDITLLSEREKLAFALGVFNGDTAIQDAYYADENNR